MSGPSGDRRGADGRWIGGLILIFIGAGLLANQYIPDIGRYAPLVVGLGLLIIFLVTRNAGALIGGAIVTGIGIGLLMDVQFPPSEGTSWIPLCLGLGFLGIWVFGGLLRMPEARFWPLIPGGILTFVGIAALGGLPSQVGQYIWPIVLILIGLVAIASSLRRKAAQPTASPSPAPATQASDPDQPVALEQPSDD